MIFATWFFVVGLAVFCTLAALFWSHKLWFLYAVGGVLWLLASFSSSHVEYSVAYVGSSYDYLKDFSYPSLVLLFGLIGVSELLIFGVGVVRLFQEGVEDLG